MKINPKIVSIGQDDCVLYSLVCLNYKAINFPAYELFEKAKMKQKLNLVFVKKRKKKPNKLIYTQFCFSCVVIVFIFIIKYDFVYF